MRFEDNKTAFRDACRKDGPAYEKPSVTYPQLIQQTIAASPDKQMTLADIYVSIEEAHPYFRHAAPKSWKNAVRHNLSIQKAFQRIPREANEEEKGSLWRLTGESGTRRKRSVAKTVDEETVATTSGAAMESIYRYRPIRSASLAASRPVQTTDSKPAKGSRAKKREPQRRWSFPSYPVPLLPKLSELDYGEPLRVVSPRMQTREALDLLADDQGGFGIELVENLGELEVDRLLAAQVQPNLGFFEEIQLPFPEMSMPVDAEMNVSGDSSLFFPGYGNANGLAVDWHASERGKSRSPPPDPPPSCVEEAQEVSRIFFGI